MPSRNRSRATTRCSANSAATSAAGVRIARRQVAKPDLARLRRHLQREIEVAAGRLATIGRKRRRQFVERRATAQRAVQVDPRLLPLALDGAFRHATHAAISANEKPQKNFRSTSSARAALVVASSSSASPIALRVRASTARSTTVVSMRRDLEGSAALLRAPSIGVIDDQPAHDARRISHEACAVGKGRSRPRRHGEICLMQERRDAEAHGGAPPGQFPPGQSVQFGVECLEQRRGGRRIAALGGTHEGRNRHRAGSRVVVGVRRGSSGRARPGSRTSAPRAVAALAAHTAQSSRAKRLWQGGVDQGPRGPPGCPRRHGPSDRAQPRGAASRSARRPMARRGEILNAHLVETVGELQALSSSWLHVYNRERPNDSPGRVPPTISLGHIRYAQRPRLWVGRGHRVFRICARALPHLLPRLLLDVDVVDSRRLAGRLERQHNRTRPRTRAARDVRVGALLAR